jgi:hypothetical protein
VGERDRRSRVGLPGVEHPHPTLPLEGEGFALSYIDMFC